ncbi:MAG: glycosyl hydrolase family 2 [candidate division KSB1 bacterium]|nr:glycosyl hydrolase family 2 [candidate division KSB1 bacterium]
MSIRHMFFVLLLGLLFISNAQSSPKNNLEMPAIFSDNMVLQQKTNAPFWGKATPNLKVMINASWGASAKATVPSDSLWQAKLKTPKAGGPYEIKLQIGDSTIVYKNVLIGEVWVCSGQSNMEMPLVGWPPRDLIEGSEQAIQTAGNKNLRLFTVTRAYSDQPKFNCVGQWQESNPQTAANFSATAFFFGRKLQEDLKIPIGLIHTSWGGTPVQAWTSGPFLAQMEEYKSIIKTIAESGPQILKLHEWLNRHPIQDVSNRTAESRWMNLDFQDAECSRPDFDDSRWRIMNLPTTWEQTEVGNFDGVIWFRKQIEIPESWLHRDLVVELGPIDDMDMTFVNGHKVGGYEVAGHWQTDRIYTVPKELVTEKIMTIAVRVIDTQGGGGIYGSKEKLKIHPLDSGENISLSGTWTYLAVAEYLAGKFYVFGAKGEEYFSRPKLPIDLSANTPTALYNAMIHPLIPYAIKGAIWYQGESNAGQPEQYQRLFPLMIQNWRADWQRGDFPFYYVQIAPYNYGDATPSQKLREAQFLTLLTPKTGMAVTLDIGNPNNIHPANKKDVGERLARWALAKDYGKKVVYSGPIYQSMKVKNDKIFLSFKNADGGLVLKPQNGEHHFLIARQDSVFKKAEVEIKGKKLVIWHPAIKQPVAVRYAWSNTAEGTLFNGAGLPASSFRTDNWNQ